jgi:RNA polymerase sigma-70 factor (ECF subfamily)
MAETQTTQPSLLLRIRDEQDAQSWSSFEATYRPLVLGFLRRRGLQEADAADLTQEVLARVAAAIKTFEYDPEKGSFRAWLFTIVHNALRRFTVTDHAVRGSGDTRMLRVLESQPGREAEEHWNQDYQRHLLKRAADEVCHEFQDSTWRAFWATAVEGRPPKAVAGELGMTISAVYMAKHRVTMRLRERIGYLDGGQP